MEAGHPDQPGQRGAAPQAGACTHSRSSNLVFRAGVLLTRGWFSARFRRCLGVLGLCLFAMLTGCDTPLRNDLEEARHAIYQQEWSLAEKYLERYLRTETDPVARWEAWEALLYVADRGEMSGNWVEEYLETMLVEYTESAERTQQILRQLAERYATTRRPERAAYYWSLLLEQPSLSPKNRASVQRSLAALHFQLRQFDLAEAVLHECVALPLGAVDQAPCLFDLADQAAAQERLEEGQRYALQVLQIQEAPPELRGRAGFLVGDILEQQGELAEALSVFTSIRSLYPNERVVARRIEHLTKNVKQ